MIPPARGTSEKCACYTQVTVSSPHLGARRLELGLKIGRTEDGGGSLMPVQRVPEQGIPGGVYVLDLLHKFHN